MLNKQKGNMYGWVNYTWNPIKGKCSHDCKYCFMKAWGEQKPIRLVEKELNDNLGENNFIFVGSSTDMFANDVPDDWIIKVISKCCGHKGNSYLFQTKNPLRFADYKFCFPDKTILGTTLESNKDYLKISKSPPIYDRVRAMYLLSFDVEVMITIEPILDFDLKEFVDIIEKIRPKWVNIGADSKNHNLPEPSPDKIKELIEELKKFTNVKIKDNLKRLGVK